MRSYTVRVRGLRSWWPDSRNEASGKVGAVHSKTEVSACSPLSVIEILIGAKSEEEDETRGFLEALQLVPVDRAIAERAADYIKAYQGKENPDFADAIIAATAVIYDLTLVTYNRKHYPMPEIELYPVENGCR